MNEKELKHYEKWEIRSRELLGYIKQNEPDLDFYDLIQFSLVTLANAAALEPKMQPAVVYLIGNFIASEVEQFEKMKLVDKNGVKFDRDFRLIKPE